MCFEPMTMLALAGTAVSAAGQMQSAQAQANQASYNAAVAQINADTARQQGQSEAERVNAKHDKLRAQMRAAYARAGVDPNVGSADQIINQEGGANAAIDEWNTIWNRQTEAIGFENKKRDLEAQSKNIAMGGNLAAAGTFLTGVAKSRRAGQPLTIDDV